MASPSAVRTHECSRPAACLGPCGPHAPESSSPLAPRPCGLQPSRPAPRTLPAPRPDPHGSRILRSRSAPQGPPFLVPLPNVLPSRSATLEPVVFGPLGPRVRLSRPAPPRPPVPLCDPGPCGPQPPGSRVPGPSPPRAQTLQVPASFLPRAPIPSLLSRSDTHEKKGSSSKPLFSILNILAAAGAAEGDADWLENGDPAAPARSSQPATL